MKRVLIFLSFSHLFGVSIGNPANPSIMNSGFLSGHNPFIKGTSGYERDYVTNKKYVPNTKGGLFDPDDAFSEFSIHSRFANFSLIFIERLELFGGVGGSKPRTKAEKEPEDSMFDVDFKGSYQFAWQLGTKIVLIQWAQTFLSTDFTYYSLPASPKSYFKFLNRLDLPLSLEKQKLSIDEWQLSLGLSSRIFFLTPYFGGDYLHSRLSIAEGEEVGALSYKNKDSFGYFYGLTVSLSGKFHVNFEQRFRTENAYTLSAIAVF